VPFFVLAYACDGKKGYTESAFHDTCHTSGCDLVWHSLARATRGLVTPPHAISSTGRISTVVVNIINLITVYLATIGVVQLMIFTTTVEILPVRTGGVTRPLFSTGVTHARLVWHSLDVPLPKSEGRKGPMVP
jgi:hypothetical protein